MASRPARRAGLVVRYGWRGRSPQVPYVRTSAVVMGELVDVLEAVCLIDGVKPHDLAARLLFDHLREQKLDTDVATVIKAMRRLRGPKLHAVDGN